MIPKDNKKYKVNVEDIFCLDEKSINDDLKVLNIYFVLSYPRSDMGKGNISGHLSSILPHSNIIKYDGLLNTNKDLRHTRDTDEMDDFQIYKHINKDLNLSETNHMLLGDLLYDFIEKYGEYGHISFRPHFCRYFLNSLYEKWKTLDKPENLIFEIGGVINDFEVAPIIPYVINYLENYLGADKLHLVLLTECNYNGEVLKTKVIQDAVNQLNSKGLKPEYIFIRLPKEFKTIKLNDEEIRSYISKKLEETCNLFITKTRIGLIPFWSKDNLYKYNYLLSKTMNLKGKKQMFIGSKNKGKISDWRRYFINLDISDPYSINKFIDVPESCESIFDNAKKKSIEWSKLSNIITVSDDTGFFIPALNFKPGVTVKTFGGELPEDRSDKDYIVYLHNRVKDIKDKGCYFESAISFAKEGKVLKESSYKIEGVLDFNSIDLNNIKTIEDGYPLGMVFRPNGADKVWSLLSDEEKVSYDGSMIDTINKSINELDV